MSLHDPSFIRLDGTPVTGRIPARLVINGGGSLTGRQQAELEQVYGQFREAVKLSVTDFHTEQVRLSDGTRVHMLSLQDRDSITVDPEDGDDEVRLPHGFAVVTNWNSPVIYKRDLNGPVIPLWEFAGDYVPQVTTGSGIFDNQVFRMADLSYFNLPMVYHRNERILWDYGLRAGLASALSNDLTPFVLKDSITGKFNFEAPHYAVEDKILDDAGTVLYTVPATPPILLPESPEGSEDPIHLASATDAQGNQLAMQHMRRAVISPTFEIWKFKFCNERLQRVADVDTLVGLEWVAVPTYSVMSRDITEFIIPYSAQTATVPGSGTFANLDVELNDKLWMRFYHWDYNYASYSNKAPYSITGWFDPPGVNLRARVGLVHSPVDLSATAYYGFEEATREKVTTVAGPVSSLEKIILLPEAAEVKHIPLTFELNYPRTVLWRAGQKKRWCSPTDHPYVEAYWGIYSFWAKRIDTDYHVRGTPKVKLELGWRDFNIMEATTTGDMQGHRHEDIIETDSNYGWLQSFLTDFNYVTALIEQFDRNASPANKIAYVNFLIANNTQPEIAQVIIDFPTRSQAGYSYIKSTVSDVRPTNSGSYTYTSRHIIDYDHEGRFVAFIRCEVVCSGATWEEDISFYQGHMIVETDPSYTVRIWFESDWNGITAQLLLAEESITRPAFEFVALEKINPYYWPSPAYIDRVTVCRVPPELTPKAEALFQMKEVVAHQGVNRNLACADVRPDITGGEITKTQSQDGIEYSYLREGQVIPHEKYVTGQLYARTFSLNDVSEALWMLHSLACDAVLDNFQPIDGPTRPSWHYHPVIKAALAVQRHIEIRDGVIVNWSDNLEGVVSGYPPTAAPPPPALARDIKLYRV